MRAPLLALLLLAACGSPAPEAPASSSATPAPAREASTDVAGLKAKLDQGGVTLIDVRTPEEFAGGHVPGARSIPLDQLGARMDELKAYKDQDLYLICERGGRSLAATQQLASAGFSRPINVEGGTSAWRQAGYPVE